jgi:hypothetical protein
LFFESNFWFRRFLRLHGGSIIIVVSNIGYKFKLNVIT